MILLCAIAFVCHAEERWALLVGIDEYAGESITPLRGAVSDALALRDMLMKYARFSPGKIFCLTTDDQASLPNLGNIITKLEYIASEAKQGDLFLFFFAGHGISWEGENYLLAYESDIRSPLLLSKTGLSVEELNEYLAKIQSANILLILDACRNSPTEGRGDEDNILTDDLVKAVGISLRDDTDPDIQFCATIYACKPGQRAFEWPGKGRGFFSIALEEALSGKADKDADGRVTLNEVESYLTNRVPDLVKRELGGDREQVPWIVRSGSGTGDMVFSWAAEGQPGADVIVTSRGEMNASKDMEQKATQEPLQVHVNEPESPELFDELEWEPIGDEPEQDGTLEKLDWIPMNDELAPLTQREMAEGWIDATGEYRGVEIAQEEAQQNALEQARRTAIEIGMEEEMEAVEFLMCSNSLQDFQQSFNSLSQFDIYGVIAEEKKPVWSPVENIQFRPGKPPVLVYRVKLRVKITKEKSQPDPSFSVSIKPNNGVFIDGEEMILSITPTQDCYVTVFNLLSDDTVLILDPPQGQKPRIMSGGQTSSLPTEAERQSGRFFRVSLLSGKPEVAESVLVIATKDRIPFRCGEAANSSVALLGGKERLEILPTYQSALEEIGRWLVSIPLGRRTFDIQEYKIRKK